MKCLRQRKAFTIVEMVIVIAVIAILATVLVPTISGVIQKANHSADTQFAASLNVQLALWQVDNGDIASESDLRDAINYYYGTEEKPDFYAELTPKSGKQGYHYWWNATDKQVVLARYEDLVKDDDETQDEGQTAAIAEDEEQVPAPTFSGASPRSLMIEVEEGVYKNYFLMDQAGSDVSDMIYSFENLDDAQVYEDMITALNEMVAEGDELVLLIQQKIKVTAIVTDYGTFRYGVDDVEYIHVPLTVTILNGSKVYEYDETAQKVDDGTENAKIANKTDLKIVLPDDAKVHVGGFNGFCNEDDDSDLMIATPELHVNAKVEELTDIFEASATDCVIVLPDSSRYIMDGDGIYRLPRTAGDTPVVGGLGITSIDKITINYADSSDVLGADTGYIYENTLYLAFDMDGAQLFFDEGISPSMVDWTVSGDAPISVSASGKITVNVEATPDKQKNTATVTAKVKGNESVYDDINVVLVFPATVSWTFNGSTYTAPNTNTAIPLSYTDTTEFDLALSGVGYTQSGYVKMNASEEDFAISFSTSGDLFKISGGATNGYKLTLDPDQIATTSSQTLTVTYGTSTTTYVTETYTVTVTDNSASPFSVNNITDTVKMGTTYLFRVGNGNEFTLDKLFNSVKPGDDITLTIYDASKTTGTNTRTEIATSGSGFYATYTSSLTSSTWKDSKIKFSGTGVAIIEITTAEGPATLAVEVVNGKNVTSASDFSDATNYVLLNDITWGTAKDVSISGTIYGNGFAINAPTYNPAVSGNTAMFYLSGGTIDNLVINGPVYPELVYSGKTYYVAGIYATGDATITNSYIAGFREPIMANGDSLYLENTTLVGGNYANLWLQTGSLTLNNVTTVQQPTAATIGSGTVLGAGIIADKGINASNVTIIGDLTQYNWVSKTQASSYMDSDVSSLINTFYSNTTITHTVNGTGYINTGIVFQGTTGTVNNASQTAGHGYTTETISGNFMGTSVTGNIYTRTTTAGTIASIPTYGGGYTPNAQATLKPTFKHNLTLTNGVYNISLDIPAGETYTLNASGYSVSKYTGQSVTVNISCTGGTVSDNKITFSKAATYTLTYTVEDNTFFNSDGTRNTNTVKDTYTVKVVVSNSNHPDAEIDVSGLTKTTKWETSGTVTDPDYSGYYEVLGGLVITDYNEDGTSFTVEISSTNLNGLTIKASDTEVTGVSVDGTNYWMYDIKADDNKSAKSVTFTYSYTGKNGKTVTETSAAFTLEKCVTGDTLVTLADGTQKRIDQVTYDDQLLVWNFFTGDYDVVPSSIIFYHGDDNYRVLSLNFSDDTTVKVINNHGFFDLDTNEWVFIDEANVEDYIGHRFAKIDGDTYTAVTLDSYSIVEEYTGCYSIQTAMHNNFMVEGMFSITMPEYEGWFDYFEIGDNLKYDEEKMQADIELYGLYTYEEFADLVTYEQFMAFSGPYLKVLVGRGVVTYEQILDLIAEYVPQ